MVKFFPPANAQAVSGSAELFPDTLSRGNIGLIWGESGVGKTTLILQAVLNEVSEPSNLVLFINTHQYPIFQHTTRLIHEFPTADKTRVKIMTVSSFRQLKNQVMDLDYLAYFAIKGGLRVTLIVIDSLTNLYTLAIGKKESAMRHNQELNEIFGFLKDLAKRRNISILVTAEEKFLDVENIIEHKPAGGRIMNYWVDFSLKIVRGREENTRVFFLRKDPLSAQDKWGTLMTDSGLIIARKL